MVSAVTMSWEERGLLIVKVAFHIIADYAPVVAGFGIIYDVMAEQDIINIHPSCNHTYVTNLWLTIKLLARQVSLESFSIAGVYAKQKLGYSM